MVWLGPRGNPLGVKPDPDSPAWLARAAWKPFR
jgi:hypothetical protein